MPEMFLYVRSKSNQNLENKSGHSNRSAKLVKGFITL